MIYIDSRFTFNIKDNKIFRNNKSSWRKRKRLVQPKLSFLEKVRISLLISTARVGKTSLTQRFVNGSFNEKQPSTVDATCLEKYSTKLD